MITLKTSTLKELREATKTLIGCPNEWKFTSEEFDQLHAATRMLQGVIDRLNEGKPDAFPGMLDDFGIIDLR